MSIILSYFITIFITAAPALAQQKIPKTQLLASATQQKILLLVVHACLLLLTYSIIYSYWGLRYEGDVSHKFIDAIYFSIVTWTTLGYGDFQPTEEIRVLASIQALTGYVFMAITIANLLDTYREEKKEEFEKPIKVKILDQSMTCLHAISSSLLFSISLGKSYRPELREHISQKNDMEIQKLNFMINLHREIISAKMMQNIYKIITSYQTLDKISNMNYERSQFTNPTITKNPITEIKGIESGILEISTEINHKITDPRPQIVGTDSLKDKWLEFKTEHNVVDENDELSINSPVRRILFYDNTLFNILEKNPNSTQHLKHIKTFY